MRDGEEVRKRIKSGSQHILYHTKTILTNQIALFEGYNGSYFLPRHVPKIRTAFSTLYHMLAGRTTRYIPRERASALVKSRKRLGLRLRRFLDLT